MMCVGVCAKGVVGIHGYRMSHCIQQRSVGVRVRVEPAVGWVSGLGVVLSPSGEMTDLALLKAGAAVGFTGIALVL